MSAGGESQPRSRLAANLAIALAAVAITGGLIELAFGVINARTLRDPTRQPFGEMSFFTLYHPILGWDGAPGRQGVLAGQLVTQNSLGNRGRETSLAKPPGTRRVVVLGDSQAWGLGVADDETIAARLEALLNAAGAHWEALNLGVSGYGTDQAFLKYLLQGERYTPDVVVEVVFHNDVSENSTTHAWRVEKPRFYFRHGELCLGNVPPPRAPGWPETALSAGEVQLGGLPVDLSWSQTYRFFKGRSWRFESQPLQDPAETALLHAALHCFARASEHRDDGRRVMSSLLRALDQRVRAGGGRLVTLFVPEPSEMRRSHRSTGYEAVQADIDAAGLVSIDLRRYAHAAGVEANALFLASDAHLSAAGNALAAQALADALR